MIFCSWYSFWDKCMIHVSQVFEDRCKIGRAATNVRKSCIKTWKHVDALCKWIYKWQAWFFVQQTYKTKWTTITKMNVGKDHEGWDISESKVTCSSIFAYILSPYRWYRNIVIRFDCLYCRDRFPVNSRCFPS